MSGRKLDLRMWALLRTPMPSTSAPPAAATANANGGDASSAGGPPPVPGGFYAGMLRGGGGAFQNPGSGSSSPSQDVEVWLYEDALVRFAGAPFSLSGPRALRREAHLCNHAVQVRGVGWARMRTLACLISSISPRCAA